MPPARKVARAVAHDGTGGKLLAKQGQALFDGGDCSDCHSADWESEGEPGPNLGRRGSEAYFADFIADPDHRRWFGEANEMPVFRDKLTPAEIAKGPDGAVAKKHGLHEETPLWYYILKEAEQRGKGEKLGPVGATIVSEVFVGLVHGDHTSYLWLKGKNWKPTLPSKTPGEFTMADLLRFVGDISPIDGITTV